MDESLELWQAYLNNPTAPAGEEIIAFAAQEEKRLIKDISGRFELLKKNGTAKALFYNRYIETLRVYKTKEITEEEYKNDPLKKAYDDYAEAIPFRMTDLGITCVVQATAIPDYKSAVDKAIKLADKLITRIQKATAMNAEETAFIAVDLIPAICELGYIIYHSQESNEYRAFKQKTEAERKRISDKVQDPPTEADAAYIRQIKELNEAAERKWAEFESGFYKADKAQRITEQILNRIFPEQKPAIRRAIEKQQEPEGFFLLAQSHASNKLSKKLTERMTEPAQLDIYGNGSIIEKDFKLFVKGYNELTSGVSETAARLLDCLMITATRNGLKNTLVLLSIKEYLDMRGLKDEKEIRRQVKSDIEALERIRFEYKGTGKNQGAWLKVSISGGTVGQIKNGDIVFRFNQDFFESFKVGNDYLFMYFPREALSGSIKENPWKYWLGRKITEHKRMNIGKPNEDTISVKTLIDACPNYPTYEKVMQGTRAIGRRIIEPFERDLDALNPSISWEYQGLSESPKNYQDFINANVVIHWSAYPDTAGLNAGKKNRANKQRASKAKTPKKTGG